MKYLNKIFQNPTEELSLFSVSLLNDVESSIYEKNNKLYLKSFSKGEEEKQIWSESKSSPEEIVRQLYILELIKKYNYPKDLIDIEVSVQAGHEIQSKRADVVVYSNDKITPHLIAEIKAPKEKQDSKSLEQLKSYLNVKGASFGIGTNGKSITILYRPYPADFTTLSDIPKFGESVDDVLNKRKKLSELQVPKQLQEVIQNMEQLVLAHAGVDSSFDEVFKLIYAKLYDEKSAQEEEKEYLDFKKHKDAKKTKEVVDKLFEEAKNKWKGVFEKSDVIKLKPEDINNCVGYLEEFKMLGSDLEVIDKAFEYLIPDVSKSKYGQYFTPRNVIEMCVEMLSPGEKEKVIDTACGSGGFLVHTMRYLQKKNNWSANRMSNYAKDYVFGIDYGDKASKIARAMMLIAGDGKSHIYKENSLDSFSWSEDIKSDFKKEGLIYEFEDFEENKNNQNIFKYFNFDILMANPPFAGDIVDKKILSSYNNILTKETISIKAPSLKNKQFKNLSSQEIEEIEKLKDAVKTINKENDFASFEEAQEFLQDFVDSGDYKNLSKESLLAFQIVRKIKSFEDYNSASRDVLFIERNLNFLKPGGRMAIVLPQGRFNNTSDEAVRNYVMKEARLIAVVGLDVNSFKPHTGTKTSVLIVQKWNEDKKSSTYNPKIDDYEVFMAVSQKSGKDNSGNEVYKLNQDRSKVIGENGGFILDHDLKEISEAFTMWADKNNLKWGN